MTVAITRASLNVILRTQRHPTVHYLRMWYSTAHVAKRN